MVSKRVLGEGEGHASRWILFVSEGRTGRPEEERCRCVWCDQHSKKRSGLSTSMLVLVWRRSYPLILHVEWLQRFNHMYIFYMGTCTKGQPHSCTQPPECSSTNICI